MRRVDLIYAIQQAEMVATASSETLATLLVLLASWPAELPEWVGAMRGAAQVQPAVVRALDTRPIMDDNLPPPEVEDLEDDAPPTPPPLHAACQTRMVHGPGGAWFCMKCQQSEVSP